MDERVIRARINHIQQSIVVRRWPIGPWEARTADYVAPGEYRYDGDWEPVSSDAAWSPGKTLFLRGEVDIPSGLELLDLFFEFDVVNLEGLLRIGGRSHAGIDAHHTRIPVPTGGSLSLEAEFNCLGTPPNHPDLRRDRSWLRETALLQVDPEIRAAFYDFAYVWEASRYAPNERRRRRLHAALEESLVAVDLTAPPARYRQELAEARRRLWDRIEGIAVDPEEGRVFLTGHSHIDVAWLWPLRETVRKCERTFSTACRLLERYPDYHFSCSQPQLYAYTREHDPDLYKEIKSWVSEGRWECTGGMWVESDCNIPSGESLIRQVLYGLAFFREEFDARPQTCWLPDVFGYPASLPGILKGCGLDAFFTCKLHWQARNTFPYHLFHWEGIDGTRILAHVPRLPRYYNGQPTPEQLRAAWDGFNEKARYDELLFPFGYGDGGGGPTEAMLEFADRSRDFPGIPTARQGGEEAFFEDVLVTDPDLPTWVGELYLETHRGTYTTHAEIKRANRKNEIMLREAEIWSALASGLGAEIDPAPLRRAWSTLLLHQFHDILPGSSIGEVYAEAAEDHMRIAQLADRVGAAALGALIDKIDTPSDLVVFNSLPWERSDIATAAFSDVQGPLEVVPPDGQPVPAQIVARGDGEARIAFALDAVPSVGYTTLSVRTAAEPPEHSLIVSERHLENRFFRLELTPDGEIERLVDKRCRREVIPAGETANRLQLFQDGPRREAAWNLRRRFDQREYEWAPGTRVEVIDEGPVRAAIRITRRYRQSRLRQDLVLYDRVPRIDFITQVDWVERQVMLKVAFPVAVRAMQGAFEIQFGAVERPTHRNTSWDQEKFEVCAHHWADLSEAGYGVSLLNDSKYGYDVEGNVLRLTLLRGPESPDPDADRGHHEFTYALFPHRGDWTEGGTVRQGWALNTPLVTLPGPKGEGPLSSSRAFFEVEGNAVLQTIKPAEDGVGWILRLYEPHGGRGEVRVHTPWRLKKVIACNHVEEDGDAQPFEDRTFTFPMGPFEVKTFRLHPAGDALNQGS